MSDNNLRILFIGAVIAVIIGGYKVSHALYTTIAWEKAEGVVVDFERSVWTCPRGTSECFSPIVQFQVYEQSYRVVGDKTFNNEPPVDLLNSRVTLYYRPGKPSEAVLAGSDGPLGAGIALILFGSIALLILWYLHRRQT